MFYKLINETTIEKAPNPLLVDGKHIFTNSEEVFNKNGYYKLTKTDYPEDSKYYENKYTLMDNIITQVWVEIKIPEEEVIDSEVE